MEDVKKSMPQETPGYWAVLPAAVRYDAKIPAAAKLLYAEISSLTESRGYCYASNDYFLRLYGMAERTLQRHLKALETAGYIRILDGNGGQARRKIYAGVNPLSHNPDKNDGVTPTKMTGAPDKNVAQIKKENKKENDPPKAPQGAEEAPKKKKRQVKAKATCEYEPELFERFWKLYPRGEAKAEARYEWDELRPDLELMRTMSAVLKRQIVSDEWRRDGGRAIPYACRWLSHRRWEDEIPEAARRAAEGVGPYRQGGQGGGQDGPAPSERRDVLWI